jgi:hypothetical protein
VCADLYAIIKTTEKLERAFVRDAINAEQYEEACGRLIGQFKVLWASMKDTVSTAAIARILAEHSGVQHKAWWGSGRENGGQVLNKTRALHTSHEHRVAGRPPFVPSPEPPALHTTTAAASQLPHLHHQAFQVLFSPTCHCRTRQQQARRRCRRRCCRRRRCPTWSSL